MSPEELGGWLNRRPYIPLRIHVAETVHYDVPNPEFAMLGRTVLLLGLRQDVDSPLFDEPVMIGLNHITRVEPLINATPAPTA